MAKKITAIRMFVALGFVGVPVFAAVMFRLSSQELYHLLFFVFMIAHSFARVYETFFTTKERKADRMHGDWTLVVVTAAYLILCVWVVFEFYVYVKSYDYRIAAVGLLLYGMAFGIRRWGMKALGKQWAIHAVGAQKIKKVRLVKIGPYKYIRHPIYLGILLEVTSLALVANATAGLLFALLVNVPLQIIRAYFEEKTSYHRFGERYLQYKNEVSMIFPLKWLHRHLRSW